MSNDKRELIRSKIFEALARQEADGAWMKQHVILADGTHLGLGANQYNDLDDLIEEIFGVVGDDKELREFMFNELEMHARRGNYKRRREEALGWKPGMTVGSPDVPQETVDEYVGVSFRCERCDGE